MSLGDVACVAFVVAAAAFASETAEEPSRREGGQQENDVHEDARQPPLDGRSEIPEQQEDDQDAQQAQADCPFFVHSRCVCGVFGALFAHDAFQFFDRDGDFPVADDAAARLRHEDVVLDADAAEIAVGIQRVVVDDALVFPFGAALVDQRGDEVETRFVGHHGPRFDPPRRAVDAGSRLGGPFGDRTVVERPLAHRLAVVHVHAQSVAQSVGHEHRHGSCGHGVGGRAFQQAQSDKPFGEGHVGGVVHLGVHHVGLHDARHVVVRRQYDVVNVFLLLGEASAHGIGARVVRAVAFDGFAAGVAQQQPALLQHAVGVEIVERLAVLRHDRRERHALSLRFGDAFDGSRDLAFDDAALADHLRYHGNHHAYTPYRYHHPAWNVAPPFPSQTRQLSWQQP